MTLNLPGGLSLHMYKYMHPPNSVQINHMHATLYMVFECHLLLGIMHNAINNVFPILDIFFTINKVMLSMYVVIVTFIDK